MNMLDTSTPNNYKYKTKYLEIHILGGIKTNWIDVFTRQVYLDVLADSVSYCRHEKGMELYCYCFMPSHIHFIFRSNKEQPMELLRDFKKYTSKNVIKAIENNAQESRKEWLLT